MVITTMEVPSDIAMGMLVSNPAKLSVVSIIISSKMQCNALLTNVCLTDNSFLEYFTSMGSDPSVPNSRGEKNASYPNLTSGSKSIPIRAMTTVMQVTDMKKAIITFFTKNVLKSMSFHSQHNAFYLRHILP